MIRRKLRKLLFDRRGMTLVEVIASFAIVAVCTAMIVTTFGAAANLMKLGSTISQNGDAAFSMLENGNMTTAGGQLTFTASGQSFTVDGDYGSSTSGSSNPVTFTQFDTAD